MQILLQSVIIVMPRFILVKSWAPNVTLDNLNKEFRCFLWGKSDGSQGLPLAS